MKVLESTFMPNNLETFMPSRELYFNDPAEVPEEELMTEVQIPVREK